MITLLSSTPAQPIGQLCGEGVLAAPSLCCKAHRLQLYLTSLTLDLGSMDCREPRRNHSRRSRKLRLWWTPRYGFSSGCWALRSSLRIDGSGFHLKSKRATTAPSDFAVFSDRRRFPMAVKWVRAKPYAPDSWTLPIQQGRFICRISRADFMTSSLRSSMSPSARMQGG